MWRKSYLDKFAIISFILLAVVGNSLAGQSLHQGQSCKNAILDLVDNNIIYRKSGDNSSLTRVNNEQCEKKIEINENLQDILNNALNIPENNKLFPSINLILDEIHVELKEEKGPEVSDLDKEISALQRLKQMIKAQLMKKKMSIRKSATLESILQIVKNEIIRRHVERENTPSKCAYRNIGTLNEETLELQELNGLIGFEIQKLVNNETSPIRNQKIQALTEINFLVRKQILEKFIKRSKILQISSFDKLESILDKFKDIVQFVALPLPTEKEIAEVCRILLMIQRELSPFPSASIANISKKDFKKYMALKELEAMVEWTYEKYDLSKVIRKQGRKLKHKVGAIYLYFIDVLDTEIRFSYDPMILEKLQKARNAVQLEILKCLPNATGIHYGSFRRHQVFSNDNPVLENLNQLSSKIHKILRENPLKTNPKTARDIEFDKFHKALNHTLQNNSNEEQKRYEQFQKYLQDRKRVDDSIDEKLRIFDRKCKHHKNAAECGKMDELKNLREKSIYKS